MTHKSSLLSCKELLQSFARCSSMQSSREQNLYEDLSRHSAGWLYVCRLQ